ncbi:MAG: ribonuclease R [Clostridia bacterium]|nr:ribonuclease R [Clostridia bacterium]
MKKQIKSRIIASLTDPSLPPMTSHDLFALLAEEGELEAEFSAVIEEMIDGGEVVLTKKQKLITPEEAGYIRGIFRSTSRGYGFVTPDGYEEREHDFFIPEREVNFAMDGDEVLMAPTSEPPKKKDRRHGKRDRRPISQPSHRDEGRILLITKHAVEEFIGTMEQVNPSPNARGKKSRPVWFAIPDDTRLADVAVQIPNSKRGGAGEGDKVLVRILRYEDEHEMASGKVLRFFGKSESREANYAAILHENGIFERFPDEVIEEADRVSEEPLSPEGRFDLRDRLIFTADSADAKDLDDAISLERQEGGWLLGVHIADVSHYVTAGSHTDSEAMKRGTSVYFTDKVVPMLPRSLSNGACSLNGGVDRYALSALISLDEKGEIIGCSLHNSIIHSKIRGVYAELNDIIENRNASPFADKYAPLMDGVLDDILRLFAILEEKGRSRGVLELESDEAKIILDEKGEPVDIQKRERGIFERVIEQFMLCANEAVALWLRDRAMPCIYRIHETPVEEKVQTFASFAANMGLDIRPLKAKKLTPVCFASVMDQARERGIEGVVSGMMLRSLMKARYSEIHAPHFGLGIEYYAHFTSPIRRYPDLSVHRIVKEVLAGRTGARNVKKLASFAQKSAKLSSENELRTLTAERAIDDLYKAIYMSRFIGEEFEGVIDSVTGFGFFVTLPNTCEGLVRITSLDGYFEYDERHMSLTCGRMRYTLGQRVRVRIVAADAVTRKVEMELAR